MTRVDTTGNHRFSISGDVPRMMGDADLQLIVDVADLLSPGARILEIGPWLGGISVHLAERGELHVVDRFLWTEAHDRRVPGLVRVGASFRDIFSDTMAARGHAPTIHDTELRRFTWTGGTINLCLIDCPRTAVELLACLKSVGPALDKDGFVLVKHGLNPAHFEMAALLEILMARGIFALVPTEQPSWCNIAVLSPGPAISQLAEIELDGGGLFLDSHIGRSVRDPWGGHVLGLARLAQTLHMGQADAAYDQLDRLTPDVDSLYRWDEQESALLKAGASSDELAVFSAAVSFHNDPAAALNVPVAFAASPALGMRNHWRAHADRPWRDRLRAPGLFAEAYATGKLDLPSRHADHLFRARVVEIGPRLALSWVGFFAAGARSYLGIDTAGHGMAPQGASHMRIRKVLKSALTERAPGAGLIQNGIGSMTFDSCFVHADDPDSAECWTHLSDVFDKISPNMRLVECRAAETAAP